MTSIILGITSFVITKPQVYRYPYAVIDDKEKTNFGESVNGDGNNAKGSHYSLHFLMVTYKP